MKLYNTRNYIIAKSGKDVSRAMQNKLCSYIIFEEGRVIYVYKRVGIKWIKERYVYFGNVPEKDNEVTGHQAYIDFYKAVGEVSIERMKLILPPIERWDSCEQMHYCDMFYAGNKIYQDIYVYDANSSFVYGVNNLPKGFEPLKDYIGFLYEQKRDAENSIVRSKYKNKINFLIGYFARVKGFVSTRSEIIKGSNENISNVAMEIIDAGGKVYLSNTDSIVTDRIGSEIASKYIGNEAGQFKLEGKYDRLYYNSPNSYQLNDKVVWSGIKTFARENTDFFSGKIARQEGSFIVGAEYELDCEDKGMSRLCKVELGKITVKVYNSIGEIVDEKEYVITELGDIL